MPFVTTSDGIQLIMKHDAVHLKAIRCSVLWLIVWFTWQINW